MWGRPRDVGETKERDLTEGRDNNTVGAVIRRSSDVEDVFDGIIVLGRVEDDGDAGPRSSEIEIGHVG